MKISVDHLTEYFNYLDGLRESGVTNMFGASSYLVEDMDISNQDARSVLSAWMQTFNGETPAQERAESFLNKNKNSD